MRGLPIPNLIKEGITILNHIKHHLLHHKHNHNTTNLHQSYHFNLHRKLNPIAMWHLTKGHWRTLSNNSCNPKGE